MDTDTGLGARLFATCTALDDLIAQGRGADCKDALTCLAHAIVTKNQALATVTALFERGYVTAATQLGPMVGVDSTKVGHEVSKKQFGATD